MKRLVVTSLALALGLCASFAQARTAPASRPSADVLLLNEAQHSQLRDLMGLAPSSPFSLEVLDTNHTGALDSGDIVIERGGIANNVINSHVLTNKEVHQINNNRYQPQPEPPMVMGGDPQKQLNAAKARWNRTRPAHYTYTLQRSCFCSPDLQQPIEVRVFQAQVQQARVIPTGRPLANDLSYAALPVEGLFDLIQQAVRNRAANLTVSYDAKYGFPTLLMIDYSRNLADDEISIKAFNFKVASGLKPVQPRRRR